MTDYNSYPTLLQSSHAEYVSSEAMDANGNQISNNVNNNIIYNSTPVILLNSQKSDMALLQNSMINDGQTYVTIQTQSNTGATDLNGAKLLNTPIIIQNSQPIQSLQSSQYQQQASNTTINVQQQNATQMTSLTPSQLQSLSYLMQTQMTPQFIQTSNGLIQIIPQGFITNQQQPQQQQQGQSHDHSLQSQLSGFPTIGWSFGNFNGTNNPITLDNQLQPLQMNNISLPQLIPLQHVIQSNNSFFNNQNADQDQNVSTIVDLNNSDKKSFTDTRKNSRRKRKQTTKLSLDSSQLGSPQLVHPTSTNEVKKEAAESSSSTNAGQMMNEMNNNGEFVTQYDNKGRPFSFLCPDCPKKFTLNSRLSAHMRCHTGMRPFTCTVCGFSFTQKSYLIRHAAVHKEERPFHCEKCQKSYKHYGSLANHRKLHRKDDKEMCSDVLKLEPQTSDNGRSSSISSLVINGCNEFAISQSYEHASSGGTITVLCHDSGPGDSSVNNCNNISNNDTLFTMISSSDCSAVTTTSTSIAANLTPSANQNNNSYLIYDQMSQINGSINNNSINNNGNKNVFFREQQIQEDENYDEDYGEENEEEEDEGEEEEEFVEEVGDVGEYGECQEKISGNMVSSNNTVNNMNDEYH